MKTSGAEKFLMRYVTVFTFWLDQPPNQNKFLPLNTRAMQRRCLAQTNV